MTTPNTGYSVVGAPVRPLHEEDAFPVLEEAQLQGSFRTVAAAANLAAIPAHLRKGGMLAWAEAEGAFYQLSASLTTWVVANIGNSVSTFIVGRGSTASRPAGLLAEGSMYFDTTIHKPIYANGSGGWRDSAGSAV